MNNESRELYACLHLAEFPTQAMLRLRPELRKHPAAVLEGDAPFERVCSRNSTAAELGIGRGMPRAQLDLFSGIAMLRRSVSEEHATRAALLECLALFSPRIEERSSGGECTFLADIAGLERLFGPPAQLLETLLASATSLNLLASGAVSSNAPAALFVARAGRNGVIGRGYEGAELSQLPVAILDLLEDHAELFAHWGIRTLGQLAALPEEGLISRMGQAGKRLRLLARGESPHLLVPAAPAFALEECMEFDAAVELLDSLLFALHPMLDQLLVRAHARAMALARVTVTLILEGGAEHTRSIRPALPSEDRPLLLKLLHLELSAYPPGAAVTAMRLSAKAEKANKVQLGLFSPQLPEPSRLDVTLARLRAVVGEDRIGRAVLADTHQADAFHTAPFTVPENAAKYDTKTGIFAALRRLRPPEPVRVQLLEARPCSLTFRQKKYAVQRAYGPWLTSGGWWSPAAWCREQWDVLAHAEAGGTVLCCCLSRDVAHGAWHVEALYD